KPARSLCRGVRPGRCGDVSANRRRDLSSPWSTGSRYQLDFTTPGRAPSEASCRSARRDSLNLRYTARGRPVISHRLRMRVGEELRGSLASLSRAPKRSSGLSLLSTAIALSSARLPAYCFAILARRLFFSIELFLAIFGLRPQFTNGKSKPRRSALASASVF